MKHVTCESCGSDKDLLRVFGLYICKICRKMPTLDIGALLKKKQENITL